MVQWFKERMLESADLGVNSGYTFLSVVLCDFN